MYDTNFIIGNAIIGQNPFLGRTVWYVKTINNGSNSKQRVGIKNSNSNLE